MGLLPWNYSSQYHNTIQYHNKVIQEIMKVLIFLVLASLASADWTCEECEKVMKVIEMSTVSEEGIKEQIEILVAEVCPKVPNVEECVAELPGFWTKLSPIMWTYAYDPKIWCGDLCGSEISKKLPHIGIGESANLNKINNQKITGAVKNPTLSSAMSHVKNVQRA